MSLHNPTRPRRRILIASLIVLLLGTTAVAAIAFSGDDDVRFALPERREGDRMLYEGDLVAQASGGVREMTVEKPRIWKDEHGKSHAADVLVTQLGRIEIFGMEFPLTMASIADAHTWEALGASFGSAGGGSYSTDLLGNPQESTNTTTWSLTPGKTLHPCGHLVSLQGASEWSREIRVGGDCAAGRPATFEYVRSLEWEGTPAMQYRYRGEGPEIYGGAIDRIDLVVASGIAYPVEVAYYNGAESLATARLVGFEPGDAPLRYPVEIPPPTPLPPVSDSAVSRYGASFGALDDIYPIEDVVADAVADPLFFDLRDFMARNPDWRIHQGRLSLDGDGLWWVLGFTGKHESLRLHVSASPSPLAGQPLLAGALGSWYTSYSVRHEDGPGAPPLDQMPSMAPQIPDVAAAWEVYSGEGRPNVMSFTHGFCASKSCYDWIQVSVGQEPVAPSGQRGLGGVFDPGESFEGEAFELEYGPGGQLVGIVLTTTEYQRSAGLLAAPQPSPSPEVVAAGTWLQGPQVAAGLAAALLAGVAYYFWPVIRTLPAMGLFTRLRKPALLEHPTRQIIVDAIDAVPGIHYNALQRRTGLANGTLRHHLQHLVRADVVRARASGGFTCYFPAGQATRNRVAAAPVLKSEGAIAVFQAIWRRPGVTGHVLAEDIGLAGGTVGHHVKRLREAGLVEGQRSGRTVRLYLSESGLAAAGAAGA